LHQSTAKQDSVACVNLATLKLTSDQKTKIENLAGRMHEGRLYEGKQTDVPKHAKGILSAEQFAQLKAQCKETSGATKTQT